MMASLESVVKACAMMTTAWPQQVVTEEWVELLRAVCVCDSEPHEVSDEELLAAAMRLVRSKREFRPTPGMVLAAIEAARMLARLKEARLAPPPPAPPATRRWQDVAAEVAWRDWARVAMSLEELVSVFGEGPVMTVLVRDPRGPYLRPSTFRAACEEEKGRW